jgi:hypothetical protein
MHAHRQSTVWGTHIGISRVTNVKGWYQQLKHWWMARTTTRREARRVSLHARWDATHEAVTLVRADPALDMAIVQGALSMAMQPYSLIQ